MQIINRVISLGNIEKAKLEQICFKCPALLKDDLKEIAEHYEMTVTSLIVNSCTALVEDFKGSDVSSLTVHQARACLKIAELEEKLDEYFIEDDLKGFEYRGYIFDQEKTEGKQHKIDSIINRIDSLKKLGVE